MKRQYPLILAILLFFCSNKLFVENNRKPFVLSDGWKWTGGKALFIPLESSLIVFDGEAECKTQNIMVYNSCRSVE